jgi:hypothetical protein
MAGGADWVLRNKSDEYDSWKVTKTDAEGTVTGVEKWRRLLTTFAIYTKVHAANCDLGPGELGAESGTIVCRVGGQLKSRVATAGAYYCSGDNIEEIQEFGAYYLRVQKWTRVGADELVETEDPPT